MKSSLSTANQYAKQMACTFQSSRRQDSAAQPSEPEGLLLTVPDLKKEPEYVTARKCREHNSFSYTQLDSTRNAMHTCDFLTVDRFFS